jgi:predicted AAA+ superfamily ATPase
MNYLGLVFESLVIRDLRTYSEYLNYKIYYYRDNSNLEIDCIIENNNDEIIAIEIKLGSDVGIAEGIKSLNRFKNKISDQSKIKSLNIITAQNKTYTTVEGINIISFGDLYVDF